MCENSTWQAPLWLDDAYLQQVLGNFLKDPRVTIEKVDIRPVNPNGENYASVMSRLKITFKHSKSQESQQLSFIMKYTYESDPFIAQIMSGYDVYNTEMKMYEEILPQLAEILRESGDTEKLFADTLKVNYERSTIIFEDLSVRNYVVADRKKGLDMIHATMVMQKLGKFHAAGAVLNERQMGCLEKFDHGIFNRHTRGFGCVFENFFKEVANYAQNCPELGPYYHDKLLKLSTHIVDYGVKAYCGSSNDFRTLSHGDLWTTNMMMLYYNDVNGNVKKKSLKDLIFIDFQLCNWSLASVDLHYFFTSSLEQDLVVDLGAQEELVKSYHSELCSTLRKLKFKGHIPTLHELWLQYEESRVLALIGIVTERSIMTTNQSEDADIHSLMDNDERSKAFRRKCLENKELQFILKKMLPVFDRRGLLDIQK
ncbi:uncharacterized protein LOC142220185 [Haematobia irritans]|uniref:uncharacterized protein LOC142220185 n=1 Tax=Haematobia irritans TaxID=7368 RepID=UPI003F503E60